MTLSSRLPAQRRHAEHAIFLRTDWIEPLPVGTRGVQAATAIAVGQRHWAGQVRKVFGGVRGGLWIKTETTRGP